MGISRKSRALPCITVTWEDECHNSQHSPFLLLLPALHTECSIWHGPSLWSVEPAVPVVSSSKFLCTPSLLAAWTERDTKKALTVCRHCSAKDKTSACYQDCYPKYSAIGATMKEIPVILHRPSRKHKHIWKPNLFNPKWTLQPSKDCGFFSALNVFQVLKKFSWRQNWHFWVCCV